MNCRRVPKAINNVGLYVPGGIAVLSSTTLMLAVVSFANDTECIHEAVEENIVFSREYTLCRCRRRGGCGNMVLVLLSVVFFLF